MRRRLRAIYMYMKYRTADLKPSGMSKNRAELVAMSQMERQRQNIFFSDLTDIKEVALVGQKERVKGRRHTASTVI